MSSDEGSGVCHGTFKSNVWRRTMRWAWIDRDEKIISFHPIESGELLAAEEHTFWEKVITLCKVGYRIQ